MRNFKDWIQSNKIVTALFIMLFIEGLLYLVFAHRTIEAMYNGSSIGFLNNLLKGKEKPPVDFYIQRFDTFVTVVNILLTCLVLALSFSLRLIQDKINPVYTIKQEVIKFKKTLTENRRIIILLLSLFFCFYALYVTLGILLLPNYAYNKFTFFFADQGDWASMEWSPYHKGSHPIILLILILFSFLKAFSPAVDTIVLAVILNSFFGASGVFFASLFFWNLTKKYLETTLLTLLFGLSMSQLFFSVLMESYALAGCSVITTYLLLLLSLKHHQIYLGYWILAGIFSFGVTITNFAQTLICFAVVVFIVKKKNSVVTILEYIGAIVSICFFLSLLQKKIFSDAHYFFVPEMLTRELTWVKTTILNHPALVIPEILKHFFLVNFVAPSPFPEEIVPGTKIILSFFGRPLDYSLLGLIGAILWLLWFIHGVYKNTISLKRMKKRIFLIPVVLATLFSIALYSIFDAEEMFLFTCNFTFPVLLLAVNKSTMRTSYFKIALGSLVFFMGVNNLMIMRQIILT